MRRETDRSLAVAARLLWCEFAGSQPLRWSSLDVPIRAQRLASRQAMMSSRVREHTIWWTGMCVPVTQAWPGRPGGWPWTWRSALRSGRRPEEVLCEKGALVQALVEAEGAEGHDEDAVDE
jgi:hypothetical protein